MVDQGVENRRMANQSVAGVFLTVQIMNRALKAAPFAGKNGYLARSIPLRSLSAQRSGIRRLQFVKLKKQPDIKKAVLFRDSLFGIFDWCDSSCRKILRGCPWRFHGQSGAFVITKRSFFYAGTPVMTIRDSLVSISCRQITVFILFPTATECTVERQGSSEFLNMIVHFAQLS